MKRHLALFTSWAMVALGLGTAQAQNLLNNGNFEIAPVLPGWTLTETVTGDAAASVNSAQIQDFANQPMGIAGETGLWLRPFEGNIGPFMGMNRRINAALSQTVPATPGENYTLSGWSRFEANYSGGVTTLSAMSPSGAVASPTSSEFRMEFLNASNAVIGSPVTLDLRTQQMADNMWRQHTLMGPAPAGTANVRVTASANNLVFNVDPGQSGFYDNFSLTGSSAPATQKLANANLNAPLVTPAWTFVEAPAGMDTVSTAPFANRVGTGTGVWLRPFVTMVPEGDATVTQTVPASPGSKYAFSGWSRWEANYSGGQTGSPTQTRIELAFLNASNAVIGSPVSLDLRTQQMNDNMWRQHMVMGTAPAGTVSARVSAIAADMFNTTGAQSAFFDDFTFALIPEPGSLTLCLIALLGIVGLSRRR
jgi:hypothetical protein